MNGAPQKSPKSRCSWDFVFRAEDPWATGFSHGIRRVIAFVLLCIGMQITWNGAEAMLKTLLRP
jgi:hypothetical protein